ncbi:MAG: hypothetical protein GQF41_0269 [Candidatus Rifleibacterium amylolyticum]|nr:MAG: hypothetical protein GQF41_0269 [Candidatus Rifleibacterium amylolyticum]
MPQKKECMVVNKGSEKFQIFYRYAFGLLSPVLLSLAMVYAALVFYNYQQKHDRDRKMQFLVEMSEMTLATVMSNLTFADQFTSYGNRLSDEMERHGPASFSVELLSASLERHFPEGFIDNASKIWAFSIDNNNSRAITGGRFESSRLRIMERLTNTLLEFANNPDLSLSQINQKERLIRTILGPHSAPLQLGRYREGRLTPVVFEGKACYIYWRQFRSSDRTFAAVVGFVPNERVIDLDFALRHIATRMFADSNKRLAVAFVPVGVFARDLPIVLPGQFAAQPAQAEHLKKLLAELNSDVKQDVAQKDAGKFKEADDHLFMQSMTSLDVPYDAVVFAPVPRLLQRSDVGTLPIFAATLGLWLLIFFYFYHKTGRAGLPLAVSFRVLFVFSGMLPILLMIALAHGLIEEAYSTSLTELRRENTEKLARISEKSDNLKQLFGYNISQAIKEFELQPLFTTNHRQDAEQAFKILRNHLEKMELTVDYCYMFVPGGISELIMHDQRHYKSAKTVMDLFAPATYQINRRYSKFWNLPEINLDASQKTFHSILSGFSQHFLEDIFMHSYEKEIAMKFGENSADYFYTVVFSDQGMIKSYVGFAANSERLFRNFLARELDSLNVSDSTIFLAAEELTNSEFSIFPFKKMNVLNSRIGRNAMNFITRCRSSLFEKSITDNSHMYIFSPLSQQSSYVCGCVVSLAEINRERSVKRLILTCVAILLICLMYVMASFAAAHMLKPLAAINQTLLKISAGNLKSNLNFGRTDEIGQLGESINMMLEGFKRRIRLGKYVSTTLEQSLDGTSDSQVRKTARTMNGTVLFSDIRDFTTISESNPPEIIADMLNRHLETMSATIQQFGGQVEQFIGDAIVAFFPDQKPEDSRRRTILAATAMYTEHQNTMNHRKSSGQFVYNFGIGLEYGQIVAGPLITPSRSEFCIIGKAKAEAERYEQLSKQGCHTRIIFSHDFAAVVDSCDFNCVPLAATGLFELTTGDQA